MSKANNEQNDRILPAVIKEFYMNLIKNNIDEATGYGKANAILKDVSSEEKELAVHRFLRLTRVKELIKKLENQTPQNGGCKDLAQSTLQTTGKAVIKTRVKGKQGETLLHPELLIELARWVNADFHKVILEVFAQYVNADVSLTLDLVDRTENEEDQDAIFNRIRGKIARKDITKAVQSAAATNYGTITDVVYTHLFGMKAWQLTKCRDIAAGKVLRDTFTADELGRVESIERECTKAIRRQNVRGNKEVEEVVNRVAAQMCQAFKMLDGLSYSTPQPNSVESILNF